MEDRPEDRKVKRPSRKSTPPKQYTPEPKYDKSIKKQFCKKVTPEQQEKPLLKRVSIENLPPSAKLPKKKAKQEEEKEQEKEQGPIEEESAKLPKKKAKQEEEKEQQEKEQGPMEEEPVSDSEEDSDSLQCFTLVDPSLRQLLLHPRVKVIEKFVPEIPIDCREALFGGEKGSFECEQKFPGIPQKKFGRQNKRPSRKKNKDWPIQAIYQDASDDPEKVIIYYEGWTSVYLCPSTRTEMMRSAPLLLEYLDIRQRFVEARRKDADNAYKTLKEKQGTYDPEVNKEEDPEYRQLFVEPKVEKNPNSSFWYFEDLTYFHSIINSDLNLAPVFYMALCEPRTMGSSAMPPRYSYTAVNLVPRKVYDSLMRQTFNISYDLLIKGKQLFGDHKNVCSSEGCVCDRLFHRLYSKLGLCIQNLKFAADGRLDLTDFDPREPRMVIECSDRCHCDANCPRRALQKGQQKPMVVNFQPGVGYALRTAGNVYSGELICEYTGEMLLLKPKSTDDHRQMTHQKIGKEDGEVMTKQESDTDSKDEQVWRPVVPKLQGVDEGLLDVNGKTAGKRRRRSSTKSEQKQVTSREVVAESDQFYIDLSEEGCSSPKKIGAKNTSYEAEFGVMTSDLSICALNIGNVARFINHGCTPNAMFVECHSRRSEKDPLIPRIGVFALRDIPLGEEVTVAYWSEDQLRSATMSDVPCKCGADNCIQFLPESTIR